MNIDQQITHGIVKICNSIRNNNTNNKNIYNDIKGVSSKVIETQKKILDILKK